MAARGENGEAMLLGFIHHANQGEIEIANLAKENSSSSQVKNLADRVIKDHKSADDQVRAFANSHNIDLTAVHSQMSAMKEARPSGSKSPAVGGSAEDHARSAEGGMKAGMGHDGMHGMAEHKATLEKLRTLKSAEFDREFARVNCRAAWGVILRRSAIAATSSFGGMIGWIPKLTDFGMSCSGSGSLSVFHILQASSDLVPIFVSHWWRCGQSRVATFPGEIP